MIVRFSFRKGCIRELLNPSRDSGEGSGSKRLQSRSEMVFIPMPGKQSLRVSR